MTSATFPRAARLLTPDDFVRALKTRAYRGRYLWIYRNGPGSKPSASATDTDTAVVHRPQLGLMIGKRNARTAVLRNAIKRRIREQFRIRQHCLPHTRYVVRLSVSVKHADIAQLVDEWRQSLERDCRKAALAANEAASQTAAP